MFICLLVYLCVCWQCAAGCALPDHGVWPPPPRPPVVSSYSSFPSSGASGSELNREEEEEGQKSKHAWRINDSDHPNIFMLDLICIYCCWNLFAWPQFLPNSCIFTSRTLRYCKLGVFVILLWFEWNINLNKYWYAPSWLCLNQRTSLLILEIQYTV